jgi:16S rRNA (adenine1518-N6/adenine1519-N6)-dimethyltransferase
VIGNLPFFITSDILLRLFEHRNFFEMVVLMVQKEVADRLAARHGASEYGLLSATAQLYTEVEKLFTLPPAAFSPPPKVHSTVIRLTPTRRLDTLHVGEDEFIRFLKISFAQKRKTLWNNLKSEYSADALKRAMAKTRLQASVRAEALSLEQSAALLRVLSSDGGNSTQS